MWGWAGVGAWGGFGAGAAEGPRPSGAAVEESLAASMSLNVSAASGSATRFGAGGPAAPPLLVVEDDVFCPAEEGTAGAFDAVEWSESMEDPSRGVCAATASAMLGKSGGV